MTNHIQIYFFDLIKVATGYKTSLSGVPTTEEWKGIYALAKQQTIIGILFSAVEMLPAEQRPPRPLLLQWFGMAENIRVKNSKVNADAVKICKVIRKDGLRCVVLKGQGIATYYPDPFLRQCGDIDLWIEGGTKKVISYLRTKSKVRDIFYTHAAYDAPVSTEVEIHHHPTYFYNPLSLIRANAYFTSQDSMFEHSKELPDGAGKIFIPSIEFNRFYILQHIFRHYFWEGIGLRQLFDYYYVLLKGGTEESKLRTIKLFKQTGMWKFVGATMWVMQEVFGMEEKYLLCKPNEKAGKQLLAEVMIAGNFGKFDDRINRNNYNKLFPRMWGYIKRNMRYMKDYPQEILFEIPMRTYMYIWKHFV